MGVNLGGFDAFVPKEFLDGPNVVALLDEMRCKRMAKGVAADLLMDLGLAGGRGDGPLDRAVEDVMAPAEAAARVGGEGGGRKHILPGPGWKGYLKSLPEEERRNLVERYR